MKKPDLGQQVIASPIFRSRSTGYYSICQSGSSSSYYRSGKTLVGTVERLKGRGIVTSTANADFEEFLELLAENSTEVRWFPDKIPDDELETIREYFGESPEILTWVGSREVDDSHLKEIVKSALEEKNMKAGEGE